MIKKLSEREMQGPNSIFHDIQSNKSTGVLPRYACNKSSNDVYVSISSKQELAKMSDSCHAYRDVNTT